MKHLLIITLSLYCFTIAHGIEIEPVVTRYVVGPEGQPGVDFTSIQAAVDACQGCTGGAVIVICNGIYPENIYIDGGILGIGNYGIKLKSRSNNPDLCSINGGTAANPNQDFQSCIFTKNINITIKGIKLYNGKGTYLYLDSD
jgi:pectin methylesterase-like acyl-CoA thioesterase